MTRTRVLRTRTLSTRSSDPTTHSAHSSTRTAAMTSHLPGVAAVTFHLRVAISRPETVHRHVIFHHGVVTSSRRRDAIILLVVGASSRLVTTARLLPVTTRRLLRTCAVGPPSKTHAFRASSSHLATAILELTAASCTPELTTRDRHRRTTGRRPRARGRTRLVCIMLLSTWMIGCYYYTSVKCVGLRIVLVNLFI